MKGGRRKSLAKRFCSCIKSVRKTVRSRTKGKAGKESAAIAICTKSVIQTRGRTLRKFKCGMKPDLVTQMLLKK